MDATDRVVQTTTTDGKGFFEFPYGTRGIVTVNAQGQGTLKRGWPPREGGSQLRFELTPPAVVSGALVDAVSRRAVEGIVTLVVQHPLNHVERSAKALGAFQFVDLPPAPRSSTPMPRSSRRTTGDDGRRRQAARPCSSVCCWRRRRAAMFSTEAGIRSSAHSSTWATTER